jgi:hypothetical protein
VLEATFNNSDNLSLQNGARLGTDGSGVSVKPEDKSYTANASKMAAGAIGPAADFINNATAVQNLDELTVTAWYKSSGGMKQMGFHGRGYSKRSSSQSEPTGSF